ncbi:hypothetical protein TNCV_3304291 [Trichonephila clavipes]|nr:hypothetical protein TNCV_3304291 [Trichonephila clavipes]
MSVFALELQLSSSLQIWKWEIVNRHDPYQDNGTKLLYCHQSLTSVQNFELIRPFRVVAFSQRSSSPRWIEDETFNDSDIMNNLVNYGDGQKEPESLRVDKNMQGSSFPPNWKSLFLK